MLPTTLHSLCVLNLANNKISSMDDMITKVLGNMKVRKGYVQVACKFDVSHNLLSVHQTNFIQPNSRKQNFTIDGKLYLSFNKISMFEVTSNFARYQMLLYVTVPLSRVWVNTSGNQIFSVTNLVQAALNIDLNENNQSLTTIKLLTYKKLLRLHVLIQSFHYNYDCNCDMEKYLKLQNSSDFKEAFEKFKQYLMKITPWYNILTLPNLINSLKCGSPEHLKGRYLYNLWETDLQCEISRCTNSKKCACVQTPSNNTVRINCTEKEIKHMPIIEIQSSKIELYLGYNAIDEIMITDISRQIVFLDISYNLITNIPKKFFFYHPSITHLNLAGNHLTSIPLIKEWEMVNSLQVLELRGNNFTCNCSGLQLKETLVWLNARTIGKVKDLNQIKCSSPSSVNGKVIYNLDDSLFGCPFVNLVLILTLSLSLLLFFSVSIFIACVFRYYISLFFFIHFGWRFCYSYAKEETLYDAFISYSTKDSDWVIDQLINPLENLYPPYNLCLHERDFLIGEPICDNIRKAVEGSKCTVCVVSKNWLESDWCQFEFRVAHGVASVKKNIRLLIILKEEIPKNKLTGYLKFYMKTFTYLESAYPLFWSRLLNDLPKPDVENIKEENEQRDDFELM